MESTELPKYKHKKITYLTYLNLFSTVILLLNYLLFSINKQKKIPKFCSEHVSLQLFMIHTPLAS